MFPRIKALVVHALAFASQLVDLLIPAGSTPPDVPPAKPDLWKAAVAVVFTALAGAGLLTQILTTVPAAIAASLGAYGVIGKVFGVMILAASHFALIYVRQHFGGPSTSDAPQASPTAAVAVPPPQ